jgi:hypothetical protein
MNLPHGVWVLLPSCSTPWFSSPRSDGTPPALSDARRQRKGNVELRNRWVHFKVSDVHIPNAEQVLLELYGDHLLQGQVMDISESGKQGKFAVVKVDGISTPVIISLNSILGVL